MSGLFGGGGAAGADSARKQAELQRRQFQDEQARIQNENALKSQQELDTTPAVEVGGTAQTQNDAFSAAQKAKRKQATSQSVLGL